ncbi:MAG: DUF1292 domain-containing protein [Clostridia bacterium]|nr:DUF1292 domain-containing protein [Clostridia bacterium]
MPEEEEGMVTLVNDDGEEHAFLHLDSFEFNGETYVVLLPADEGEEDCNEVLIYTLRVEEDGSETLLPIDDEAELDMAFEEFKNRMNDEYDFE